MQTRTQEIISIGDRLFNTRGSLMSLWQDIAENFYPERADFTLKRVVGDDFCSYLMTGFPALQMRELADQLAAMLRPRQKLWAKLAADDNKRNEDVAGKQWMEWASERQRKAMYAQRSQFLRATKTGDYDFAAFGQAVIRPSLNADRDGLLYRTYHLRDCAWQEGVDGQIDWLDRKEKRTARELNKYFPRTVDGKVADAASKEPHKEFECRHIVVPADTYELKRKVNKDQFRFVSLYIDVANDTVLEELPQRRLGYVIPRWRLGAFNQYATSPCTMLALPDARLLQQMTLSILEASEKASNPPMVATVEAVRTDMQMYAGGTTWVDREYDERLGEALRPLNQDTRGLQYGFTLLENVREMIKHIFFLNKLNLPEVGKDMTAFEVGKRIEEYVRSALPLFEPMETEYNGALCSETFALMMENNAFGPLDSIPESLRGADVHFEFVSPLQQTAERAKAQAFQEALDLTAKVAQVSPDAVMELDFRKAYRDALGGVEVPSEWLRDPKMVDHLVQVAQAKRQQDQQVAGMAQAAGIANKAAPMVKALQQAA